MRHETQQVLSAYLLGEASLDLVRRFVEDVNWDALDIPEDERALLLKTEAYLAGMDEDLNDESDLRDFLTRSTSWSISFTWKISEASPVITGSSTNTSFSPLKNDLISVGAH